MLYKATKDICTLCVEVHREAKWLYIDPVTLPRICFAREEAGSQTRKKISLRVGLRPSVSAQRFVCIANDEHARWEETSFELSGQGGGLRGLWSCNVALTDLRSHLFASFSSAHRVVVLSWSMVSFGGISKEGVQRTCHNVTCLNKTGRTSHDIMQRHSELAWHAIQQNRTGGLEGRSDII